jgi:hypothetical protein
VLLKPAHLRQRLLIEEETRKLLVVGILERFTGSQPVRRGQQGRSAQSPTQPGSSSLYDTRRWVARRDPEVYHSSAISVSSELLLESSNVNTSPARSSSSTARGAQACGTTRRTSAGPAQ